ncbi:MAG: hypothetical protein WBG86_02575, partial [Polyangiales bacterium]
HEGSTVIRDSTFSENIASTWVVVREGDLRTTRSIGGAIAVAPLMFVEGPPMATAIERSLFVENVAHTDGTGAGHIGASARGGAVAVGGARIRDATFDHNWASAKNYRTSSSQGGGAALRTGRLESARFFRNRVDGVSAQGGALLVGGPATIVNSIFWGNQGSESSGIQTGPGWLLNSTLVDNAPGPQLAFSGTGELVVKHSVVAGGHRACDIDQVASGGYNVLEENDCLAPVATETDQVVGEALVEKVYNRSGAERVWGDAADIFSTPGLPLFNSRVVDGGDPNGCKDETDKIIATDNLGAKRNGPCDVGAFAFQPGQRTRTPLTALLLRRASPRAPEFFAGSGCVDDVTQKLSTFINESIVGDSDRPPDQECDGLIDAPMLLVLDRENDGSGFSLLKPTGCVATHVACEDPWFPFVTGPGRVDFRVLTDGPCTLGAGSVFVEPGSHGCIEADIEFLDFDVGIPFEFLNAELIGELDVLPDRISNGVLRGFIRAGTASGLQVPKSMQETLVGATVLSDLLCAAEVEEQDGLPGFFLDFDVEFEAVTLFGRGLPPVRPVGCE